MTRPGIARGSEWCYAGVTTPLGAERPSRARMGPEPRLIAVLAPSWAGLGTIMQGFRGGLAQSLARSCNDLGASGRFWIGLYPFIRGVCRIYSKPCTPLKGGA